MPGGLGVQPTLCQIAITTLDVQRSVLFYSGLLGFTYTGSIPIRGRTAARLLDETRVDGECHWLAGDPEFFQLEFFRFNEPPPCQCVRQPYDYGYSRITVAVADVDLALARAIGLGATLVTGVTTYGGVKRACIRDPDGVLIELVANTQDAIGNRIVGVGATVDDLAEARRYYCEGMGLTEREAVGPEREALWQTELPNTERVKPQTLTLAAGRYWLELTRYDEVPPGIGRRRHRLTNQGLMNIALGVRSAAEFHRVYRHVTEQGHRSATEPVGGGLSHTVYLRHDEGLSVELLQLPEAFDSLWGFSRPGIVMGLAQGVLRFLLRRQRQPA